MSQERVDIHRAKAPRAAPQPGRIRTLNRARILQAAEQVFAEQGYRGATTAAIARRAGLPKANLHYYFGTKEALYRAVLEGVLDLWLGELDAITADQDPGEALSRYIHAKVMYSKTRPHASRVFANEVIRGARAIKGFLGADLVARIAEKATVLEAWAAAGKMERVDPVHLFSIIWAASQHYADFEAQVTALKGRATLSDKDYQAAAETITRFVLRGCGIRG
jgi:TetR/AcrR family transcriptional regulator